MLAVSPGLTARCHPHTQQYELSASPPGTLANLISMETGVGGPECPYIIKAGNNQSVQLTLRDFHVADNMAAGRATDGACVNAYAIIREPDGQAPPYPVCSGTQEEELVYTSAGSSVKITILGGSNDNKARERFFFISYHGKLQPPPPHHTHAHPSYIGIISSDTHTPHIGIIVQTHCIINIKERLLCRRALCKGNKVYLTFLHICN